MRKETLILLSTCAIVAAGVFLMRNKGGASVAGETVIIQRGAIDNEIPWQNKLPSDYEPSSYVFNFGNSGGRGATSFGDMILAITFPETVFGGGGLGDIIIGGVNMGDTVLNMPTIQEASSCNMCQGPSEASEPLLPYAPVVQEQKLSDAPKTAPQVAQSIPVARNGPFPLMRMAAPVQRPYQGTNGARNIGFG